MIEGDCFTRECIDRIGGELNADRGLLEKAIHAFALLGRLVEAEMNFVFKGGTSLLLHLPEPQRLSIDIDIITAEDDERIDSLAPIFAERLPFIGFSEDDRGHRGLPERRHFKYEFNSVISGNVEYVLLDIVKERDCRIPTEKKPIVSRIFDVDRELYVTVPTVEGLLGDKLTAFGFTHK